MYPFLYNLCGYITWSASPVIAEIGSFSLRWYGLMFALCIFIGFFISTYIFKREKLPTEQVVTIVQYVFFGGIIGARLGQIFFYDYAYYLNNPSEMIKIWHGGLASHGGALGIFLALYLYTRKDKIVTYNKILDVAAISMPLIGALIRIGNLFNSEIVGKYTTVSWGFIFAHLSENKPRHPSQLYESLMLFGVFAFMWWYYHTRKPVIGSGMLTGIFFLLTFTFRFILEFWKDTEGISQWYNLPFAVLGAILIYIASLKKELPEIEQ